VKLGYYDWFTYTIHFQNTGTAAAINIQLRDTLDSQLDEASFEVLSHSHSNVISLSNNLLTVDFPNIYLPDSTTNEPGSKGFIQYRIKPKTRLTSAATVTNTAAIYFDFNAAIVTNTVVSSVVCDTPSIPTLSASSLTNCGGQKTTLRITGGNLNDATYWQWYSGNCGGRSIGSDTSIDVFPTVTTTYYVRGEGGCVTEGNCASITITVTDITPPTAKCKNTTITLSGGVASIMDSDVDDISTDNCGIQSMTISQVSFNCNDIGNNPVTITVTDNHNNSSTCVANVNVVGMNTTCSLSVTPASNAYTGGVATNIYLGYGPQSATLTANTSGGSGFTYSWTGTAISGSGSSVTFAPSAIGNYSLACTVTNQYGCQVTCSVVFCVKDIRSGGSGNNQKVNICHIPPGNPNNPQTLSISINGVASHLTNHSGDALGTCTQNCGSSKRIIEDEGVVYDGQEFSVLVYPNPSTTSFYFEVESESDEEIGISLFDINGKQILAVDHVVPHQIVTLGSDLAPGIYMIRVKQGGSLQIIKISKVR
jgi:hypothetical protein